MTGHFGNECTDTNGGKQRLIQHGMTNLPMLAFRSHHAASAWPSLVEGAGESHLQAGRDCLSVPTWHHTAISMRRSATCRRAESAPAAFFNVQRPCRPINQTRYCRWPCLSGRRQSLMEQSANWRHVRNNSACFLFSFKTYSFSVSFPAWLVLFNIDSPSAFAVSVNLRYF